MSTKNIYKIIGMGIWKKKIVLLLCLPVLGKNAKNKWVLAASEKGDKKRVLDNIDKLY